MNVTLTPELDRMVRDKVARGLYDDADEVVRDALRQMFQRDSGLEWLRHEAARGFEQLEVGNFVSVSRDEFLQQMHVRHSP